MDDDRKQPDARPARRSAIRRSLQAVWLCLPLAMLAALAGYIALRTPDAYRHWLLYHPRFAPLFAEENMGGVVGFVMAGLWIFTGFAVLASLLGALRRRWGLKLLRIAFVLGYVASALMIYLPLRLMSVAMDLPLPEDAEGIRVPEAIFWQITGFAPPWDKGELLYDLTGAFNQSLLFILPAVGAAAVLAVMHVVSWRRRALAAYGVEIAPQEHALGDRIVENTRTWGDDPRYRKSIASTVGFFIFVLYVLPWLASQGCIRPYEVPWGSGTPAVQRVQVMQVQRKKKRKKYVLRTDSPVIFRHARIEESDALKAVQEMTQRTYQADVNSVVGKMGAGGGKKGGWPDGVPGGEIRFIRIKHGGPGWADGMGRTNADKNFLSALRKEVPFPVALEGESHRAGLLKRYPKGKAPPFMYLTGEGPIRISGGEMDTLRKYCLQEGGMLFADAGSARFDREFRGFVRRLFPGKQLVTISDDDPIFQMPYAFPHGAPPLWKHGGRLAMGVKHAGRWVVFYHPGDLNDAWKDGASGLKSDLKRAAFQTGINVLYYAITHYLEETRKFR